VSVFVCLGIQDSDSESHKFLTESWEGFRLEPLSYWGRLSKACLHTHKQNNISNV